MGPIQTGFLKLEPDEWVLPKINVLEPRSSPGADHRRDKPTAVPKRSRRRSHLARLLSQPATVSQREQRAAHCHTPQYLLKIAFDKLFDVVRDTIEAREQFGPSASCINCIF